MLAHYQIVITFATDLCQISPRGCCDHDLDNDKQLDMTTVNKKKRLVTSIHNLSPEQLAEVKALYPLGFNEVMQRIDKPDGTFFYVVPYETEDTYYLLKIDFKVDDAQEDDNDGYYDEDDLKGADELADTQDEPSDDDF